jgi:hypothetical protein
MRWTDWESMGRIAAALLDAVFSVALCDMTCFQRNGETLIIYSKRRGCLSFVLEAQLMGAQRVGCVDCEGHTGAYAGHAARPSSRCT